MIAVLKHGVTKAQQDNLIHWLESQNVRVHVSEGEMQTVIGLIGDTRKIDIDLLSGLEIIHKNMTGINFGYSDYAKASCVIQFYIVPQYLCYILHRMGVKKKG